jgi:DNA-binding MarR family transcriptional regulator
VANVGPHTGELGREAPLGRLLAQVERRVSRRMEAMLAAERLTPDQWRVLDLLADGTGRTMSQIAGLIGVPSPTLTKIIDKLVDAATVYRLVDDRDRRRVLAFISNKGRAVHERLAPAVAAAETEALAVLGDDAAVLLTLLARLADEQ